MREAILAVSNAMTHTATISRLNFLLGELYAGAACVVLPQRRPEYPYGSEGGGLTALLEALAMAKPLVASDKPILARVSGGIVAPALADLPLGSALFGSEAIRSISWQAPGPGIQVLLRAPVPFSCSRRHAVVS